MIIINNRLQITLTITLPIQIETKSIDLLTLKPECDVDALVDRIILEEPLLSDSKKVTSSTYYY